MCLTNHIGLPHPANIGCISRVGLAMKAALLRLNGRKSHRLPSGDRPICMQAGLGLS
jgi:hypothetical protein